jgi:hypothetical protein
MTTKITIRGAKTLALSPSTTFHGLPARSAGSQKPSKDAGAYKFLLRTEFTGAPSQATTYGPRVDFAYELTPKAVVPRAAAPELS